MGQKSYVATAALLLSAGLVAGCMGGSTYGTGVSQETQLLTDITGIVGLSDDKQTEIDYSSRPGLVKAPKESSELPPPAETVESDSAYFPTNPEERRAALRDGKKKPFTRRDGGIDHTLPGAVEGYEPTGATTEDQWRSRADDGTGDREPSAAEMAARSKEGKASRLKRMQEIAGTGLGTGPRRYLTQPPSEYRTPADSAPVGQTGEYEYGKKEKKPLLGGLFGG